MLNWPRIRCALTRHGRIGLYQQPDLRVYVCCRCGQLMAVWHDGSMEFIDKVHFPDACLGEPELEGVWEEWRQT